MALPKLARARSSAKPSSSKSLPPRTDRTVGPTYLAIMAGGSRLFRSLTAYKTAREMAISKTKRILAVSSTDSDRQIIDSNRTYFAR